MHPFTLERPRDLAAALALRAQAGLARAVRGDDHDRRRIGLPADAFS